MRLGRIQAVALIGMVGGGLTACASSAPQVFGQYHDLAPRVAPTKGERSPQHLSVALGRPANVAIFLVVPGRGSTLLFPGDSTQSEYVESGTHLVETAAAKLALSDTSRLIRRPAPTSGGRIGEGQRGRTGLGRDSLPMFGFNQHGYLLIYASQDPLPYSILQTRVAGLSIPIEDDDALNTVMKLIRESTHTTGPWAAYATEYP